ncbi:MAG: glycosyltransferase family 87 protein [Anaerolineales bacterium]|nr:glycosyltransferase family 87 protein [Anaerolineales bacterium]
MVSRPLWMQVVTGLAVIGVLIALTIANFRFAEQFPGGNDFLGRWMGARFWVREGISPYDPQVGRASQQLIYGRAVDREAGEDIQDFLYPFPAMVFFAPFGALPYTLARAVWMTILEVSLPILALMGIALADWKPRRAVLVSLLFFSVLWYHGTRAVIVGQFAVIEALLMVGALLAIKRGSDPLAGILLGLSIAKPQMAVLFIPFVLLWAAWARRWSIVVWGVGTITGLLAVSVLLIPDWPVMWLRQLLEYPTYTNIGSPVEILADAFPSMSGVIAVAMGGALTLYLFWEWAKAAGKADRWFQWSAALTIVVTNLVAFRSATTNYVVLLPALCLIFSVLTDRWRAKGNVVVLLAMVALLFGLWGLFLTTIEGNVESPLMYLPVPILTLLGLWWARWWAIRAIRLSQ